MAKKTITISQIAKQAWKNYKYAKKQKWGQNLARVNARPDVKK